MPDRPRSDHGDDERHPSGWRVSPGPDGRGAPPSPPPQTGGLSRWVVLLLVVLVVNVVLVSLTSQQAATRVRVSYTPVFLAQLRAGNVAAIDSQGSTVTGRFRKAVAVSSGAKPATLFKTEIPTYVNTDDLGALLESKHVVVNAKPVATGRSTLLTILLSLLPTLLIVGLIFFLLRGAAGMGGAGAFARSRARRVTPSSQRLTFADVAGVDEAKDELSEIVDFLREPDKYRRLGGRIPRGVLLTGPPGTGKTLLARAMAGEADVPFFSISASEFVELFVGVGASRVRDLFAQAKEAAPAIIFIDELDAIGRARGPGGVSGGHEEREQTLNQILTEMDGFDPSIGVIVLAATNRAEVLDRALLRPGRFDRRVVLGPPDTPGRRAILGVHTRSVPLAADVDLDALAAATPGMVGADLANVVNEGALIAARRGASEVGMDDLTDALDKLILGSERKIVMSAEERRRTAYHEAGHAIVGLLTPGADPVRKVSIIPHGASLGVTVSAPAADRFSYDERYLEAKLDVALAGRCAEDLVFGDVSTGAENDIRQATELARHMVGSWGMSDAMGPMTVLADDDQAIAFPASAESSDETRRLLDREVRRILDEAGQRVAVLLRTNRAALDALADALVERETLDAQGARAAAGLDASAAVA